MKYVKDIESNTLISCFIFEENYTEKNNIIFINMSLII